MARFACSMLPAGVQQFNGQAVVHLIDALGRDVDVSLEIAVLIHGGQHRGRRRHSRPGVPGYRRRCREGRADLVVSKLLPLRRGLRDGSVVRALSMLPKPCMAWS